jgi:hypothetical protein
MRYLWKIVMVVGAAGLVFMGVGAALGANMNGLIIRRDGKLGLYYDAKDFVGNVYSASQPITDVRVNVRSGNMQVRIIEGDGYGYKINHRQSRPLEYSLINGVLTVSQTWGGIQIMSIGPIYRLGQHEYEYMEIYLPRGACLDSLTVNVTSGSAEVSGIRAAQIELHVRSGNLTAEVDGPRGDYYVASSVRSGNMRIGGSNDRNAERGINASVTSGNMRISFTG